MAKKSDIQAQIDALTAQLDEADDDEDYEVWVKNDKGHETRIPSKKASGWLKDNFGISLHDDPAPAGDGGQGGGDGGDGGDPKPAGGGYFSKRKS